MKNKWKELIIAILIPLAVGGLSAFLTMDSMQTFQIINKPESTPPAFIFPIVWTILYILMGISSYLIWVSDASDQQKSLSLRIYGLQLVANFLWSIIFFNLNNYLFAFIWIVFLWLLIIIMIISFFRISKVAAYIQIPYLLWVTFAAYLNFMIYVMNIVK